VSVREQPPVVGYRLDPELAEAVRQQAERETRPGAKRYPAQVVADAIRLYFARKARARKQETRR
jgi:hypothetical protein